MPIAYAVELAYKCPFKGCKHRHWHRLATYDEREQAAADLNAYRAVSPNQEYRLVESITIALVPDGGKQPL